MKFFRSFTKSLKICKTRIHNLTVFTKFSVITVLPSPPDEHCEPVFPSPPEEHRGQETFPSKEHHRRALFPSLSLILFNEFNPNFLSYFSEHNDIIDVIFYKLFWNDFIATSSVLLPQNTTRTASERMQQCNILQKVVVWSFFRSLTESLKMCKTRIHNLTAFTKFSVILVLLSPPEEHREPFFLSPPE